MLGAIRENESVVDLNSILCRWIVRYTSDDAMKLCRV
jgi:hypothetical protein